jgi:hypothetical protein
MTTRPHTIQVAMLYDQPRPIDLDAVVKGFLEKSAAAGIHYNVTVDVNPGLFYRIYGRNNVMITFELCDKQANPQVFAGALTSPFVHTFTPDAAQRVSRHRSHILIGVEHGVLGDMSGHDVLKQLVERNLLAPEGSSLGEFRQRLAICEQIMLDIHRAAPCSLVHWTQSNLVVGGERLAMLAGNTSPGILHVHPLLFDGGKTPDGRSKVAIKTFGAAHFIGREIHVLANPVAWINCAQHLLGFIKFALMDGGYVIPDGDTFGPETGEFSYRVRHIAAGAKSDAFDGPLYTLHLLHDRESGYTAPPDRGSWFRRT